MSQEPEFESFDAAEIFCPKCRVAQPVVRRLLLVLPNGNEYEYRCSECRTPVGSKLDGDNRDFRLLYRP